MVGEALVFSSEYKLYNASYGRYGLAIAYRA